MSATERPWARHYMEEWHSRAGDSRFPHWLRVAALAYGSHHDNGHAPFKRGQIALVLGSVDRTTGEVSPYGNVGRAIADAVAYGWLAPESYWGCLVVPAHAIKKGQHGRRTPCPVHVKRARRRMNRSLSEPKRPTSSTLSEPFDARSPHSVSGSQRKPLSLLSPTTSTTDQPEAG